MKILLAAVNAKYIHSNLAVYCLRAYAKEQHPASNITISEYTINQPFDEILMDIYKQAPDVLCLSCYLWNVTEVGQLIQEIPKILPDTKIWLGGPEVSYNAREVLEKYPMAEGIMRGEGEETFAELVAYYEGRGAAELINIQGITFREKEKQIAATPFRQIMDLSKVPFVYGDIENFKNRIIYYETSRGCPFSCSYCLSSIDKCLRFRNLELVKKELQFFIDHEVPQVKFVDRTFNCKHDHAMAIWNYIKEHDKGITNFHFEVAADLLNEEEIEKEMAAIAETGLQEILILTGESKSKSNVEYIGKACEIARKYFKVVGLEVYPMNSDEYAYLHKCGADYVTVFQETYNSDKYETLHLAGHKRIFPYRLNTQERALKGGMRGVGFAALLGLDDFRKDAFATGYHAYLLQRKYPHAEIAFSCPRLRPIINNDRINPKDVHEPQLLQVVCAYRLFMPFASITVSTRECERVRDNLVNIAATKISAGVSTGIGSHVEDIEDKGDDQFEISDGRSVDEVFNALKDHGLQPVMNDYIYL